MRNPRLGQKRDARRFVTRQSVTIVVWPWRARPREAGCRQRDAGAGAAGVRVRDREREIRRLRRSGERRVHRRELHRRDDEIRDDAAVELEDEVGDVVPPGVLGDRLAVRLVAR